MINDFIGSLLRNPGTWVGVGIGLASGFLLSSGFAFSAADGSRFLGGLLGSLIAVAGAISLYYLKESDGIQQNRKHMIKLAEMGYTHCADCLVSIEKKKIADLQADILMLSLHTIRVRKFFDEFEFSDHKISEVSICFDDSRAEELKKLAYSKNFDVIPEDALLELKKLCLHFQRCYGTVIQVIKLGKDFGPARRNQVKLDK